MPPHPPTVPNCPLPGVHGKVRTTGIPRPQPLWAAAGRWDLASSPAGGHAESRRDPGVSRGGCQERPGRRLWGQTSGLGNCHPDAGKLRRPLPLSFPVCEMGAPQRPTAPGCCVAEVRPFCLATPGGELALTGFAGVTLPDDSSPRPSAPRTPRPSRPPRRSRDSPGSRPHPPPPAPRAFVTPPSSPCAPRPGPPAPPPPAARRPCEGN